MTQKINIELKQMLVKMVIDAIFDPGAVFSENLQEETAMWLLDDDDWDIKDRVLRSKFDEILNNRAVSITGRNMYAEPVLVEE